MGLCQCLPQNNFFESLQTDFRDHISINLDKNNKVSFNEVPVEYFNRPVIKSSEIGQQGPSSVNIIQVSQQAIPVQPQSVSVQSGSFQPNYVPQVIQIRQPGSQSQSVGQSAPSSVNILQASQQSPSIQSHSVPVNYMNGPQTSITSLKESQQTPTQSPSVIFRPGSFQPNYFNVQTTQIRQPGQYYNIQTETSQPFQFQSPSVPVNYMSGSIRIQPQIYQTSSMTQSQINSETPSMNYLNDYKPISQADSGVLRSNSTTNNESTTGSNLPESQSTTKCENEKGVSMPAGTSCDGFIPLVYSKQFLKTFGGG